MDTLNAFNPGTRPAQTIWLPLALYLACPVHLTPATWTARNSWVANIWRVATGGASAADSVDTATRKRTILWVWRTALAHCVAGTNVPACRQLISTAARGNLSQATWARPVVHNQLCADQSKATNKAGHKHVLHWTCPCQGDSVMTLGVCMTSGPV